MNWIDWLIVSLPMTLLISVGLYAQRYNRSVADFLSGGRLAGRYLLAVAKGEMQAGAVVFVASFEVIAKSGFTITWWNWINVPVAMLVALSGFIIYRYRQTRALTLAQFFEIRYSKRFRIFTGVLGFAAGILNFGIIPAVGARFLTYFLGFPQSISILGYSIQTPIVLMAVLLTITLFITLSGGLITLLVTNCLEGIVSQVLYLVIIFGLISMFNWSDIVQVLSNQPRGESLVNPFDSLGLKDFNLWYVLMSMVVGVYGTMAWQNQSAYNAAALNAHESVMGGILGRWREMGKGAVVALLAVCAMTYLAHPHFELASATAHVEIASVSDPKLQEQMRIPIAVEHMLPNGLKGALCVILLMGVLGGDGTHLHSWGSLFIQDVLVPLRRKPFTTRQHINLLRLSMAAVALFAFLFGILFQQTEYIVMWWQVTTGVYVAGAGAVIIGGLYWKKGTTAGAWAALIAGSGLSTLGILTRQFYSAFPLNGMEIFFYSAIVASFLYIAVSLLTCRENFNMEQMLHRGPYGGKESDTPSALDVKLTSGFRWSRIIGIDENYTRADKWIAGLLFAWGMGWFAVFVVGSVWNLIAPWPASIWAEFWKLSAIGLPIFLSVVTAVWFTWGGLKDTRELFRRLSLVKGNALDNGMVVNHQNLDESVKDEASETQRGKELIPE